MHQVHGIRPLFFAAHFSLAFTSIGCAFTPSESDSSAELNSLQTARLPIVADFSDCVESIGVEVVSTQAVRARVPAGFTLAGETAPVTPVVVRTANCRSITLNRAFPEAEAELGTELSEGTETDATSSTVINRRPVSIVQIGALVVPPDGSGDVNVYTVWYHTNALRLLAALRYAGVQATGALIDYDHRPAPGLLGVSLLSLQNTFALNGHVGALSAAPIPFVSNWWASTAQGIVKFNTSVPALVIGNADLTLQATTGSAVTSLLGSTASFSVLEQFNGFASAQARF